MDAEESSLEYADNVLRDDDEDDPPPIPVEGAPCLLEDPAFEGLSPWQGAWLLWLAEWRDHGRVHRTCLFLATLIAVTCGLASLTADPFSIALIASSPAQTNLVLANQIGALGVGGFEDLVIFPGALVNLIGSWFCLCETVFLLATGVRNRRLTFFGGMTACQFVVGMYCLVLAGVV